MLLAFDVGNTETTVGLFAGDRLDAHWRWHSTPQRTPDEWASTLTAQLTQSGHSTQEVGACVVASVAPQVGESLCEGIELATTQAPVRIDARSKLPIVLDVDEPLTVGADRIVNTLAAVQLFKQDTIVVDFGTATTFDCITVDGGRGGGGGGGRFIGGVIMPGLRTASDELVRKTAKLPATELTPPTHAIGRRTEDCIRVGVLWGAADAVDGLVRRIKAEWPTKNQPLVVATGGLATLVAPLCKEIGSVHSDLTLIGLRIAAAALGLKW
jgi:type III pantothenate kinase